MDSPTNISVLIRTFNSAGTLEAVLSRLQLIPGDEIIIVDSGSNDSTLAVAERFKSRIVRLAGPFNYSRALNAGFEAAAKKWVLVLSSHCIPASPQFLPSFRESLQRFPENVAVAYGPCLLAIDKPQRSSAESVSYLDQARFDREKQRPGGNVNGLYRMECWRRHRFDERLPTAEDLEWFLWALGAGYVVADVRAAAVIYRNKGSLRYMYAKGFGESIAYRKMMGSADLSFFNFVIGIASLFKRLLLGQIPPAAVARQSAHLWGAFCGYRKARLESARESGAK